jgi:hypothetical protein
VTSLAVNDPCMRTTFLHFSKTQLNRQGKQQPCGGVSS